MNNQRKAYCLGLLAVAFWSTVATAFKLSLRHQGPEAIVFQASLTSALVLGLILLGQGQWRKITALSWASVRSSLILGALNPFLYYLILLRAYDLLPAQEAQVINYTWAITMTILAVPLLKQRIRGLQYLAIVLGYAGAMIIFTRGDLTGLDLENPRGFALALASTIIWALFWISGVKDNLDPLVRLLLNFCCGAIYTGSWALINDISILPGDTRSLLGAMYIGVFEMGVSYVLWIQALKLSRTTAQISNLIYLAPVLSLLLIHFLLGEPLLASTVVGLAFILCGTATQQIADRRHALRHPSEAHGKPTGRENTVDRSKPPA